jgi:glutathione synthase/RimK-type ligase-like ATP-grasp enzyme
VKASVCALVEAGDVPGRNPLIGPLRQSLTDAGITLGVYDPTRGFTPPEDLPVADLYLLKGDHPLVLTAAGCVADLGGRCLNDLAATEAAADKARTYARLAAAGIPIPASTVVAERNELGDALKRGARWVKPLRGAHGEGVALLDVGEEHRAPPGPWLVQEPVEGDGSVLKVYGVGAQVAVRRARTEPGRVDVARHPVPRPDPAVVDAAVAAAAAARLVCFGADIVSGPSGPLVIDLNAFPGYRTVDEAPGWITTAVRCALEDR